MCFLISDIVHRDLKLENILVKKLPDATNPEDKLQIKVRPNKKIAVFRVIRPYLSLLVKPNFFFRFSGKI